VVFSVSPGFLHQYNWLPRYNCNIVESGVKHHRRKKQTKLRNTDHFQHLYVRVCHNNLKGWNFVNFMELIWQHWMFQSIIWVWPAKTGFLCYMYGVFALNNLNDTNYLPQLYQNDLKHKVNTSSVPWLWDKREHLNFYHNDIVCPVSSFSNGHMHSIVCPLWIYIRLPITPFVSLYFSWWTTHSTQIKRPVLCK
jgi:hypothetical protein